MVVTIYLLREPIRVTHNPMGLMAVTSTVFTTLIMTIIGLPGAVLGHAIMPITTRPMHPRSVSTESSWMLWQHRLAPLTTRATITIM